MWHALRMEDGLPSRLEVLRPLIRRRWETLLRCAPSANALANPDTLIHSMDLTIGQLVATLRAAGLSAGTRRRKPLVEPVQSHCGCGLNPLLAYFITGEQAIIEAAAPELGSDLNDVLILYHGLAQREIEALCGVCRLRDSPHCTVPRAGLAADG